VARAADAIAADCQYRPHVNHEYQWPIYKPKIVNDFLRNVADGRFGRKCDQRKQDPGDQGAQTIGTLGYERDRRRNDALVTSAGFQFHSFGQVRNHGTPTDIEYQEQVGLEETRHNHDPEQGVTAVLRKVPQQAQADGNDVNGHSRQQANDGDILFFAPLRQSPHHRWQKQRRKCHGSHDDSDLFAGELPKIAVDVNPQHNVGAGSGVIHHSCYRGHPG